MAYYIRHFGLRDGKVSTKELTRAIEKAGVRGTISVDSEQNGRWTALTVNLAKNQPVAYIERCAVAPGSLGFKAIQEFLEELEEMRPESGATWVSSYLEQVQVVAWQQLKQFQVQVQVQLAVQGQVQAPVQLQVQGQAQVPVQVQAQVQV